MLGPIFKVSYEVRPNMDYPAGSYNDESYVFLVFLLLNLANWPSIFIYDLQFRSLLKIIQPQYLFGVDTCSISGKKYQINLDGFQSALRV